MQKVINGKLNPKLGLSVGGSLDLEGTSITQLPEGLSVSDSLYLRGTPITQLPEGLSVGGYLDLEGTSITQLPEGLSVGGSLYLEGTSITQLPEGLSVGGSLYLEGTSIIYGKLKLDIVSIDGISSFVLNTKQKDGFNIIHAQTCKILKGEIIGDYHYIIKMGKVSAHGKSLKEAFQDINFKILSKKGSGQFENLDLEELRTKEFCINAYRIITGACRFGTQKFLSEIEIKDNYTINEVIELTNGRWGHESFKSFFKNKLWH